MKKISCFLAAVMLFVAMASSFMPASTVQAFTQTEFDNAEIDLRISDDNEKMHVDATCFPMQNDGYIYVEVNPYSGPDLPAEHYPELYDLRKNKVARFESFIEASGDYGSIYKLKIDNQDEFQPGPEGYAVLLYRMNMNSSMSDEYIPNLVVDNEGYGFVRAYCASAEQCKGSDNDSDKKKTTYRTPVGNAIKQVVAVGGSAEINGITALSYDEMKELSKNPDAKLVMYYTYNDVKYKVIITGEDAVLDPTIPWYGPLYLASKFGNSLTTAE